jgi:hypothetical protein
MDAKLRQHLRAQARPVILLEGTRKLPAQAHGQLRALTAWLCAEFPSAVFRSGNADGTDTVFADAVAECDPARLELVLPHAGMGRKRRPPGARSVALEDLADAGLERIVEVTRKAGRDAGRLGDYYRTHRHGPSSAATSKATYQLRDTLKVTGSESLGLAPASLGIFFVNEADPTGGGTGHTIRVCEVQGVPVATQTAWGRWCVAGSA